MSAGILDEHDRLLMAQMLHPTGEFAARFLIIAMIITPMRMLMPRQKIWVWLLRRRRYIGMAAFFYALAHTVFYIIDRETFTNILNDLPISAIWTGWLASIIFIPLAVSSNDTAVRYLGLMWKKIQRLVYPAAVFTLVHWIFVHNGLGPALVHFIPLAGLELYRIYRVYFYPSKMRKAEV